MYIRFLAGSHLHISLSLRVQPLGQFGGEVTSLSQVHPSLLSMPSTGQSRATSPKHIHSFVSDPFMGHVGSATPTQSEKCGSSTVPLGHVGLLLILQLHASVLSFNPVGQIGLERISHEHSPFGFTIGR